MKILSLKSRAVCSLLLAGIALACGGKSATQSPPGGDGGDSSGDGDGDGDEGGGGTGGVGDGDGGSASGGVPSDGGTSPGGGAPASGGDGTGGSDDVVTVATLGEPCVTPGSFACAEANPKLALICGGDGEWEARETCSGDAVCDSNEGANLGTCRSPIAECQVSDVAFCDASNHVVMCAEGGFATEVVEECLPGYGCEDGACVLVDDPCLEEQTYNCSSDCGLMSSGANCRVDECNRSWGGALSEDSITIVRLPNDNLCNACERTAFRLSLASNSFPYSSTRFTVGPGWGLIPSDIDGNLDSCAEPVSGCVVLPPTHATNTIRDVLAVLLSDSSVSRNVTIEPVPDDSSCD